VINSFVKNILTPLITIPGKANFGSLHFTNNGSTFCYSPECMSEIPALAHRCAHCTAEVVPAA